MNWAAVEFRDFVILGFAGFFALVWAAGLALTRHRSVHFAGMALVFMAGARLVWEAFFFSGGAARHSLMYGAALPLMYAIGPVIFFYYRALAKQTLGKNAIAHVLIVIPAALPFIAWAMLPAPERIALLANLFSRTPGERAAADWLLIAWIIGPKISILFYSLLIPFHRAGEALAAAASLRGNIKWFARGLLVYIWTMIIVDILGYLLGIENMFRWSAWSQAAAVIIVYLYSRMEPAALMEFEKALEDMRYARSKLGQVDVEAALMRIEHLMTAENYYADEDLRLATLARACGLSPHQVSEILNEKLGLSFPNFVNKHRTRAAAKLLREDPRRGILSIAMAVGFNSKSAFHRAFHRFHGKTPGEFRRDAK